MLLPDPDTYYSRTRIESPERSSLISTVDADVCIVGAGIAGLSCALELTQRGQQVVILDAQTTGWGASGRNGGFVGAGYAGSNDFIRATVGDKDATELFNWSVEGVRSISENIQSLKLSGCSPTKGTLSVIRYDDPDPLKRYCSELNSRYGYQLEYQSSTDLRQYLNTDRYFHGYLDKQSYHMHPLNYCLGLASEIERTAGQIYEHSTAISMELDRPIKRVITEAGVVHANDVVLCGGGYAGREFGKLRRSLLPIATYVAVTDKLGPLAADCVNTRAAVVDDRRASDYYRIVDQDRLLWGGRITAKTREPSELASLLKRDMEAVYPQLTGATIDVAWSGLMAYARHRMPYIGQLQPGVWCATAFGGHGLNTGAIGGRLIAEGITGESSRYRLFNAFKQQWNGGVFGPVAAQVVYTGLRIGDWLTENRSRR